MSTKQSNLLTTILLGLVGVPRVQLSSKMEGSDLVLEIAQFDRYRRIKRWSVTYGTRGGAKVTWSQHDFSGSLSGDRAHQYVCQMIRGFKVLKDFA